MNSQESTTILNAHTKKKSLETYRVQLVPWKNILQSKGKKWVETGDDVCDRTVRNWLNEIVLNIEKPSENHH